MKSDPLATLGRLQRRTVDDERLALAAAQREVTRLEAALLELRAARRAEIARPCEQPDLLGRYLERTRQSEARLIATLDDASGARDVQAGRLDEARLRMRQIERLEEIRRERAAVEAARRERRDLDDLTLIRRAAAATHDR